MVIFTGSGFSAVKDDIKVVIDGIECPVLTSTMTAITCTTGKRPGLVASSLSDVDKTEILNVIIVEGSIIFAPETNSNHQRNFEARYVFLRNGSMEVGTEEFPYTSKIL